MTSKYNPENLDLFDRGTSSKKELVKTAAFNAFSSILNKTVISNKDSDVLVSACDSGFLTNKSDFKELFWISAIGTSLRGNNEIKTETGDKFPWKKINRTLSNDNNTVFNKEDSIQDLQVLDQLKTFARDVALKDSYFESLALNAVRLYFLSEGSAEYSKEWLEGLTEVSTLERLRELGLSPSPIHPVSLYLSSTGETYFPESENILSEQGDVWNKDPLAIASVIRNWAYHEDPIFVSDENGKRHVAKETWFQWLKTVDAESQTVALVEYPEFVDDVNQIMDFEPPTQRVLKGLVQARFNKERTNDDSDIIEAVKLVEEADKEESKIVKKSFQAKI